MSGFSNYQSAFLLLFRIHLGGQPCGLFSLGL